MKTSTVGRVLRTTLQLFQDRGYLETSMRDIAEGAKVTEGSLLRRFRTKRELLEQTLRCHAVGWFDPAAVPDRPEAMLQQLDRRAIEAAVAREMLRMLARHL
jgi:AcrR family transcriptional regulator